MSYLFQITYIFAPRVILPVVWVTIGLFAVCWSKKTSPLQKLYRKIWHEQISTEKNLRPSVKPLQNNRWYKDCCIWLFNNRMNVRVSPLYSLWTLLFSLCLRSVQFLKTQEDSSWNSHALKTCISINVVCQWLMKMKLRVLS